MSQGLKLLRTFPATPQAPSGARRTLVSLTNELGNELMDDLQLIASELVTNAVCHAHLSPQDAVELKVNVRPPPPGTVRMEVRGPGVAFEPARRKAEVDETFGRGLFLVSCIVHRWGVRQEGAEVAVWAEIDLAGSAPIGTVAGRLHEVRGPGVAIPGARHNDVAREPRALIRRGRSS
ncbi:MAG: ATP-binding protein [Actinomycetota bacterium]